MLRLVLVRLVRLATARGLRELLGVCRSIHLARLTRRWWGFRHRLQKVALVIVHRLQGVFGVLSSGFRGRLSQIIPYLVLLAEIDFGLRSVNTLGVVEFGPSEAFDEDVLGSGQFFYLLLGGIYFFPGLP